MKRKALGKGLRALIPEAETHPGGEKYREIALDKIVPSGVQPRARIDQDKLSSLVHSIKSQGILQPILVRPKEGKFQLIAGERRFRAAIQAGLEKISALMTHRERVIKNTVILIKGLNLLKVPIFITEQYPKGLGPTEKEIAEALEGVTAIQKMSFSCCSEP